VPRRRQGRWGSNFRFLRIAGTRRGTWDFLYLFVPGAPAPLPQIHKDLGEVLSCQKLYQYTGFNVLFVVRFCRNVITHASLCRERPMSKITFKEDASSRKVTQVLFLSEIAGMGVILGFRYFHLFFLLIRTFVLY